MKTFKEFSEDYTHYPARIDPKIEYEQRNDPDHPYCTNWPMNNKKEKKDENI